MYDGGPFTVYGSGKLPPQLTATLASMYARVIIKELRTQERIQLEETTVARFLQAVEQAATEITATSVLTRPGEEQDGVYTNSFVAVGVPSVDKFVDLAAEAMRLWNQLQRNAEGGPRLVFDVAELHVGSHRAYQYSLDLAAADGAPAIPEIRQAMEKLFGPGGKLTLLLVKVDDRTALLAAATPEQVAAVLEQLIRKQPMEWNTPPLAAANRLLPDDAQWRAFFSPHGYTSWSARKMDAVVGVPVIGGPLVKQFPTSPPIGATGRIRDGELSIDIAVPRETVHAAGSYLH
jgi:hypothetical protein